MVETQDFKLLVQTVQKPKLPRFFQRNAKFRRRSERLAGDDATAIMANALTAASHPHASIAISSDTWRMALRKTETAVRCSVGDAGLKEYG